MRFRKHRLLQQAIDEPLSTEEQLQLQQYQATDKGRIVTNAHDQLSRHLQLQDIDEINFSKQELKRAIIKIDTQVQRNQRARRTFKVTRDFAVATAVIAAVIFVLNWGMNRNIQFEPAAATNTQEQETAVIPTPTLLPGMSHINLAKLPAMPLAQLPPNQYMSTIPEIQSQVTHNIYIPTQLNDYFTYIGAMINEKEQSTEIAFHTNIPYNNAYPLWILSQAPINEPTPNQAVPIYYQPFADETNEIEGRTEEIDIVYGTEALFETYNLVSESGGWATVHTLSWQIDENQFTLTQIAPTILDARIMILIAEGFQLAPIMNN